MPQSDLAYRMKDQAPFGLERKGNGSRQNLALSFEWEFSEIRTA
jgi:hypothetical protein